MPPETTTEFLFRLEGKGVDLTARDGRLRYGAARGTLSAADIHRLKEDKAQVVVLLESLQGQSTPIVSAAIPPLQIPSREQEAVLECRRAGFDSGADQNHIKVAIRLRGALEIARFRQAVTEILKRHEILRTRFVMIDAAPRVVIDHESAIEIEIVDLSQVAEAEREQQASRLASELVRRAFSVDEPLIRLHLLRLSSIDHVFLGTIHQLISDEQSRRLFIAELSQCYVALSDGKQPLIGEAPLHYGIYAHWQRGWLDDKTYRIFLSEIKRRLPGALRFPPDLAADKTGIPTKVLLPVTVPPELVSAVALLCQEEKTPPYVAILTALKLALAGWTGQSNISVAAVTHDRRPELANTMGPLAAIDPINTDLSPGSTFRESLRKVTKSYLQAHAFRAHAPLSEFADLVNVFVSLVPSPPAPPTHHIEPFRLLPDLERPSDHWALIVRLTEFRGRIDGVFEFNSARFSRTTVETARELFLTFLQQGTRDVDARSLRAQA